MRTLLAMALSFASLSSAQTPPAKDARKIYVDELHFPNNPDLDGLMRSKLIGSLAQHCGAGCTVVEPSGTAGDGGQDIADAVLTGTIVVQTPDSRHYRVQGAMRLVDKEGTVLWADTVYSSTLARSATSSFADSIAKKLALFLSKQ